MAEMEARGFNQNELADFIGVSPSLISGVLIGPKKATEALWLKLQHAKQEDAARAAPGESLRESPPPYRAGVLALPLGHVQLEGRDWKIKVPFYTDDDQNAHAVRVAKELLNAVGDTGDSKASGEEVVTNGKTAAAATQTIQDAMDRSRVPHATPSPQPSLHPGS